MDIEISEKQRKVLSEYCISTSKAVFIAALVGAMMGKASFGGAFVGIAAAMLLLAIGLLV